ncbi:putative PPM-type phosphatase domain, protein phosphatase 2C family [Helianthus annuus]|nr:putative PPM-type phosphatase domain, protein phosphatase 2C family [Helianthus annuus]KAJ0472016.1 putative PPM-type phosphatase domain-containing protein [Helianthus annuus]KAJ0647608.1 putative PPM-type phosphatase domain-containing protein [Helianthus annuus]
MSRAFGDFCLKDYGLISVLNVYYHKLTDHHEFMVLATNGVWDVLKNDEVLKINGSMNNRSMAARSVVDHAVKA